MKIKIIHNINNTFWTRTLLEQSIEQLHQQYNKINLHHRHSRPIWNNKSDINDKHNTYFQQSPPLSLMATLANRQKKHNIQLKMQNNIASKSLTIAQSKLLKLSPETLFNLWNYSISPLKYHKTHFSISPPFPSRTKALTKLLTIVPLKEATTSLQKK